MRVTASESPGRRRGAVLVIVAFGMVALLTVAAMVVDVNLWTLERAKLEQACAAASRAGYVRLKELDYNYQTPATKRSVDAVIREYLELNGLTEEEAATSVISVNKRNDISVTVRRVTGTFFARAVDVTAVNVRGDTQLRKTNDITPFAVPPRYQDPDHNQIPNFVTAKGKEGFVATSTPFVVGRPYIIKFGRPVISLYDDMLLIPMDNQDFVIPAKAFADLKIPLGVGGEFGVAKEGFFVPKQHTDTDEIYRVGMFRAYGAAYRVMGAEKVDGEKAAVSWLLGFAGGSFLIKQKYLEAVGFTFKEGELGYGTLLDGGKPTNVVAVKLHLSDSSHPKFVKDQAFIRYLTETLQPKGKELIKPLILTEQPQVLTITGSGDPVTTVMDYSGIPYVAANDAWDPKLNRDPRSSCKDCFKITDRFPQAFKDARSFKKFLETCPNAAGRKGVDWVHIHHEDFTEGGLYPEEKRALVEGIRAFVREGHHHLFAACLAIETMEIFLAESVFGPKPLELVREMLDFDNTLAFRDFDLDKSRGGAEKVGWISSIDTEKFGPEHKWFMTDYLNPRCQNHAGLGGVYLDLDRFPAVLTRVTSGADLMLAPEGSTNSVRRSVLKPHRIPEHNGLVITDMNKPLLILGCVGNPAAGVATWKGDSVRYLTGVLDDDANLKNGHGEFTYLGGHRPADEVEGTYSAIGDLFESSYYDWPHTLIPEKLKIKQKDGSLRDLTIDWNADGKIEGFAPMMKLNRADQGIVPRSVPESAQTSSEGWPTKGEQPHGLADPKSRWTKRTGKPNYVSPINSSSAVVHDYNNDGDDDDVYPGCLFLKYRPNLAGYRLYLNNILYGSVAVGKREEDASNLGAINPGGLKLGEKNDNFGSSLVVGDSNSFRAMLQYGFASKTGMPVGTEFETAPGDFEKQVQKSLDFNFRDERNELAAVPWAKSQNGSIAAPGQIKIVPICERADDPRKSFYYGTKSHRIKVVGFARFFVVNTAVDQATLTESRDSIHYLGGQPLPGEIRGYFLGWVLRPDGASVPLEGEDSAPSSRPELPTPPKPVTPPKPAATLKPVTPPKPAATLKPAAPPKPAATPKPVTPP